MLMISIVLITCKTKSESFLLQFFWESQIEQKLFEKSVMHREIWLGKYVKLCRTCTRRLTDYLVTLFLVLSFLYVNLVCRGHPFASIIFFLNPHEEVWWFFFSSFFKIPMRKYMMIFFLYIGLLLNILNTKIIRKNNFSLIWWRTLFGNVPVCNCENMVSLIIEVLTTIILTENRREMKKKSKKAYRVQNINQCINQKPLMTTPAITAQKQSNSVSNFID